MKTTTKRQRYVIRLDKGPTWLPYWARWSSRRGNVSVTGTRSRALARVFSSKTEAASVCYRLMDQWDSPLPVPVDGDEPVPLPYLEMSMQVRTYSYDEGYEKMKQESLEHQPCGEPECLLCGTRDCPDNDPLHYDKDGCPSCTLFGNGTNGGRIYNP